MLMRDGERSGAEGHRHFNPIQTVTQNATAVTTAAPRSTTAHQTKTKQKKRKN